MKIFTFHKNCYSDNILAFSILILLLFINSNNFILLLPVIFTNILYWLNKNSLTYILDTIVANIFIIIILIFNYKEKNYFQILIFGILALIFFLISFYKSLNKNNKQLIFHIGFRISILILFINIYKKIKMNLLIF